MVFGFTNGMAFGLTSADLAGYSTVLPDFSVDFVGSLPGGGTVTTNFMGSGIDFRTAYFGPEWSDLTGVQMSSLSSSLDNVTLSVPEPGAGALALLGTCLLIGHALWRRRS
jgi:hypothetical protein